jgi:glycosyltransferase involved in cell wall biosynthesis
MRVSKLSIIIPVFNEAATVTTVLDRVIEVPLLSGIEREIIVVDDASRDGSNQVIRDYLLHNHSGISIKFEVHAINTGKGGSVRTGISKVTGDYFIIQDADLELDPHDFNKLLLPVLEGRADVVFGSRFAGKRFRQGTLLSSLANRFLTFLSNSVMGTSLTDMETCYKLIPSHVMNGIKLVENRFGFEPEITAKLSKIPSIRIFEVPVNYRPRTDIQGKKIGWKDGVHAIGCIIKYGWFSK